MTEYNQPPGGFRDAWVDPSRPSLNSGNVSSLRLMNGGTRVYTKCWVPNLAGRTVIEATLTAHVWRNLAWDAQTVTAWRASDDWAEGRITSANQPGIITADAVSVTTGALDPSSRIEFDVTAHIQAIADGAPNYGWRIGTGANTLQRLTAVESGDPHWELHIVVSDSPDVPSNLRPDAGAVETPQPIVAWDFVDLGGESTTQAQARVQVDTPLEGADPDDVTPDFDTDWFPSLDFHFDLTDIMQVPPTTSTRETYWRVNVQDADGNESGWSDWASYTVDPKPTLVVDSPVGVFGDPTPAILAHLTSGAVESWRVHVTGPDRSDIRARSGRRPGWEPINWAVPLRVNGRRVIRENEVGWANVRVYPVGDRAVAVGQHTYVDQWIRLELDSDVALAAPTGLHVTPLEIGDPRQVWSWQRTEAADAWLIQVDGLTIARLAPEDVTVNAGAYRWTDNGEVPPLRPQNLAVRAVEGNKRTQAAVVNQAHTVEDVWLLPTDGGTPVVLAGDVVSGFAATDARATYAMADGNEHDIIYGHVPRKGEFEGMVAKYMPGDMWAMLDQVEKWKQARTRLVRMVWGSQSELVRLRDPDATSATGMLPEHAEHVVRFSFIRED